MIKKIFTNKFKGNKCYKAVVNLKLYLLNRAMKANYVRMFVCVYVCNNIILKKSIFQMNTYQ